MTAPTESCVCDCVCVTECVSVSPCLCVCLTIEVCALMCAATARQRFFHDRVSCKVEPVHVTLPWLCAWLGVEEPLRWESYKARLLYEATFYGPERSVIPTDLWARVPALLGVTTPPYLAHALPPDSHGDTGLDPRFHEGREDAYSVLSLFHSKTKPDSGECRLPLKCAMLLSPVAAAVRCGCWFAMTVASVSTAGAVTEGGVLASASPDASGPNALRDFLLAYRSAQLSPEQHTRFVRAIGELEGQRRAEGNHWEVVAGRVE